jgi:fatty acid-binding protein DegV
MRTIGLVVDTTCDLPREFLRQHGVEVLPGRLRFGDRWFTDCREPRETMEFYRRYIADRSIERATRPAGADRLRGFFTERLVTRFDRVLVLCRGAEQGGSFEAATQASYGLLSQYRSIRSEAGLDPGFVLRVVRVGSAGPGEAVAAQFAVRRLSHAPAFDTLRREVEDAGRRSVAWLVPQDPRYLRAPVQPDAPVRARGWRRFAQRMNGKLPVIELASGRGRTAGLARTFAHGVEAVFGAAREAAARGLADPAVVMSFGGDPRVIRNLPAYQAFEGFAADRKLDLQLSVMSATLAAHAGPGCFAAAWIPAGAGPAAASASPRPGPADR